MDELLNLAFKKELALSAEEAIEAVTKTLKDQGFGIITEINVQETFRRKLDRDFRKYVILGACNPDFAYRSLSASLDVGLLLPCNVVVYEKDDGHSMVAAINPAAALQVMGDENLKHIADEVSERLKKAVDAAGPE